MNKLKLKFTTNTPPHLQERYSPQRIIGASELVNAC